MKKITIADSTLRQEAVGGKFSLTFKEKIELAKELAKLGVNIIETAPVADEKTDALLIKTLAMNSGGSILSCTVGMTAESVSQAWESVKGAEKPRLHVIMPVSPVKMEYDCGMKPQDMLSAIKRIVSGCAALCNDVEFSADDATRAQPSFLSDAINAAIDSGATTITLCDTAGILMPDEHAAFIENTRAGAPRLSDVTFGFQCSSELKMGTASVFAAIAAGAELIKLTVNGVGIPAIDSTAHIFRLRGDHLGCNSDLDMTGLKRALGRLTWAKVTGKGQPPAYSNGSDATDISQVAETLDRNSTITDVASVLSSGGYNLSPDDEAKVFEAFQRIAIKKNTVGTAELDMIVASTAMQVPATYKITNYVINSGNLINSTANLLLEKDGEALRGISGGEGPIDAAFQAIEQIVGRHYELDDFQISAVTEGRGAMGSALIKLRSGSGLYSGRGVSTDIIEAAIRAYIDALNKIVYEEGNTR